MAVSSRRHREGADGDWFIDDRCIGCGASTSVAPDLIGAASDGRQFVFVRQPVSAADVVLAQHAAEICPVRSIGTESGLRWVRHHPVEVAPGVWRTGYNAQETAGGNAFVVPRPDGGLLIDAPRSTQRLHADIERLGGIDAILLTHRDDVGDAEQYASAFAADVVIHERDKAAAPFATRLLAGQEPTEVLRGVLAIPTPGHTEGHVMYLVDDETLFTGDSLAWDPGREDLWAEKFVCWWSWSDQLDSLERLARHRFVRVIPTHGAVSPTLDPQEMRDRLLRLVHHLRQAIAD
jgi:glyoxylase-like metal-dependent hydrolase (beta-lactamase superfamily II)/ferredoxin